MAVFVNSFFERRLQQLFELAGLVEKAFSQAGLEYRVVGGLATYLYMEEVDPDSGRLTRDIDILVRREDLARIARAVEGFGLQYRHVAGLDMLVQAAGPSARRAVHLVFAGEKVQPGYLEAALAGCRTIGEVRLAPLPDLVGMNLTSFRLEDQMHLQDLDNAGLITPEIEADFSAALRERLSQVRASD